MIRLAEWTVWNLDASALALIALRTALVYVVMVAGIRLSGKRQLGQMTPFDLVVLLLVSNAVQNAMTGPDTSLTGGIVSAATLLTMNLAASVLSRRYPRARQLLVGQPVALIQNGQVEFRALDREQLTLEDLQASLREHDCADLGRVALATLEVDGEISVVRTDPTDPTGYVRSKRKLVRHHKK